MKFNSIILLFLIASCSPNLTAINQKKPYTSVGFAYIYNDFDFNEKLIKKKLDNNVLQISQKNLKTGTLVKIINPKNKKSIVLKNIKRIRYPDFYKILITKSVAEELSLNEELPILEILEIKKNKSFVAKKAKIFNEEKKYHQKHLLHQLKSQIYQKIKAKKPRQYQIKYLYMLHHFIRLRLQNF